MIQKPMPALTLVSPSRSLVQPDNTDAFDFERFNRAENRLTDLGWRVSEASNIRSNVKRFAGSDQERTDALEAALLDEKTDLVLALRGGYGAGRLLSLLNWERLRKARAPLMGLSDITALHLAFLSKIQKPSWQGPCAAAFALESAFRDQSFLTAFQSDRYELRFQGALLEKGASFQTEGMLWGGNLSVLVSLLSTEYFPRVSGGILFLEDVAEPAYRIERMLLQLGEAGVLEKQNVVLLGSFTGADRAAGVGRGRYTLSDAFDYIGRRYSVAMISGLPFGHITDCVTIPVGVAAQLTLSEATVHLSADVGSVLPLHAPGR